MHKVIVERPRGGRGWKKYRYRPNIPLEDLPQNESMFAGLHCRKWFGEHLGPLKRWVRSQIGRSWNDAYSEACRVIKPDSVVRAHIKTHLLEMVERNTFMRNGKVYCHRGPWSRGDWEIPIETPRFTSALAYVHPETGLLCALPPRTRQTRMLVTISPPAVQRRWLVDGRVLLKLKGCWFVCEVRAFPERLKRGERPYQFDLATHRMLNRSQAESIYGQRVYGVAKRQLCRKELAAHGLKNDPFGSLTADAIPPAVAGLSLQIPRFSGGQFWWFRPATTNAERFSTVSRLVPVAE